MRVSRKALLVGINDYRGVADLRGCVNDVSNLRMILKNYCGFANEDIRVLCEGRATKRAIVERLRWLARGAQPGDYRLFHFSGHGSQIRDRDELDELDDGLDELICPYDMDWAGTFLTDDQLRKLLRVAPGVKLEVILDCCHSGTSLRESQPSAAVSPELSPHVGSRFLAPPFDIEARHEGVALTRKRLFRGWDADVTLWAGCTADQQSADAPMSGVFNGAFTFYFCKHLRDAGGEISRGALLEKIRASLRDDGYVQTPQLESRVADAAFLAQRFGGRT